MSGQTHAPVCLWGSVVQSAPSPGLSTGRGEGGEAAAAGDLAADLCLTQGVRSPRGRETLETWSLRTGLCFCPCVLLRRPEQDPRCVRVLLVRQGADWGQSGRSRKTRHPSKAGPAGAASSASELFGASPGFWCWRGGSRCLRASIPIRLLSFLCPAHAHLIRPSMS